SDSNIEGFTSLGARWQSTAATRHPPVVASLNRGPFHSPSRVMSQEVTRSTELGSYSVTVASRQLAANSDREHRNCRERGNRSDADFDWFPCARLAQPNTALA